MADANRKAPRLGDAKFSYADARNIVDADYIYVGEMLEQIDSTLEVRPATAVSGVFTLGVATQEVDNTDDGEEAVFVSTAIHGMDNAGNITKAHVGEIAYVVDAATVGLSAASDATTNVAGIIVDVDSDYVYVDFDPAKKN